MMGGTTIGGSGCYWHDPKKRAAAMRREAHRLDRAILADTKRRIALLKGAITALAELVASMELRMDACDLRLRKHRWSAVSLDHDWRGMAHETCKDLLMLITALREPLRTVDRDWRLPSWGGPPEPL